jgi:integrase
LAAGGDGTRTIRRLGRRKVDVGVVGVVHEVGQQILRSYCADRAIKEIGLDPAGYGTHSVRRTKPTLIYRRTRNLRAVQLLLGHTKLESTVRYLGIEVDDALEIAEQTEV